MVSQSPKSKRRRSGRLPRELPIRVSGIDALGRDFTAPARTRVLSRYGAEILVRTNLVPEQEINVSLLDNAKGWDARVVGLFSRRPDGYEYGIEFLSQEGNFWDISFPPAPGPSELQEGKTISSATVATKAARMPAVNIDLAPILSRVREGAPSKTYLVRLKCLQGHFRFRGEPAGDGDQWLILRDRHESLQQVLAKKWEFTCSVHGPQRERPLEAKETDAGFQMRFATSVAKTLARPERDKVLAKPAAKIRRERRNRQGLRVWVQGVDRNGNYFRQSASSLDVSRNGARLDGPGMVTLPGTTVEVRHNWRKAQFRVVWTGQRGTPQASQIGLVRLQPGKSLWNIPEGN